MLKGINPILTGDLLKALSDMGHGDEIVIADGNFAATALSTRQPPIWAPSSDTVAVLAAVLEVFPVDDIRGAIRYIAESPRTTDAAMVAAEHFGAAGLTLEQVRSCMRKDFYRNAVSAYAVVATTDPRHWHCFILRKGALPDRRSRPGR